MALVFDGLPQGDNNERIARICENCLGFFPIDGTCPKCIISTVDTFDKQFAIQKIKSEQTPDLQVVIYHRDLQNKARNFILANM